MLIAVRFRHDAGALQAEVQRFKAHNMLRVSCRIVCLRYYTRFLVNILEDEAVVLEGLFSRVLEHFAHVFCSVSVLASYKYEKTYRNRMRCAPSDCSAQ